jgi:hypothetical protein
VPGGGGTAPAGDEEAAEVPADRPPPAAEPAGAPVDPAAADASSALLRCQARDACFADGTWRAGPAADAGRALIPVAAFVGLGVLGGHWGAGRAETEPRGRRRFLI